METDRPARPSAMGDDRVAESHVPAPSVAKRVSECDTRHACEFCYSRGKNKNAINPIAETDRHHKP